MHTQEIAMDPFHVYNHFSPDREHSPIYLNCQTYEPVSNPRSIRYPPYYYIPFEKPQAIQAPIMASEEDMAKLQKLSNEYEPDLQGPLVGPKQSSDALATEYAQADPIFSTKTSALSQTHSHYRVMKGDGNCGWRAVSFGYFENLFRLRNATKVAEELTRIKAFNKLLDSIGQQEHLYEIFVDATEELLNKLLEEIQKGNYDDSFLIDAFNDDYNCSAIITHFRLMTSAWMRLNPERYEAFLSLPLDQYCSSTIDTVRTEIDEIGLQGLVDGIVEGSGFAVEILYLDRSEGQEVTPHLLTPSGQSLATIRLLYRPGHYDLLYRTEPSIPQPTITPVNYQYSMTCDYTPWYPSALPFDLNPVLMAVPSLPLDPATASSPQSSTPQYAYPTHTTSDAVPQTMASPMSAVSERQSTPGLVPSPAPTLDRSSELPIRMNPLVIKAMENAPFTTIPFRNSPYNLAHFQNPHFQPSQWDPNAEYK